MLALRSLYHLVAADFKERVRRYGFFVTIGLALLLSYQLLSGTFFMALGDYRGVYNAAWMGLLMSLTLGLFIWLFGFYLVRGGIERDRATGVGQILATTPMRKASYVVGKFASSLMVLLAVTAVLVAAALLMLLTQGEDKTLHLGALISPFLLITLPVAAMVAALTVFFEIVPILRRSFGSFVFFMLSMSALGVVPSLLGFDLIRAQVIEPLQAFDPTYDGSFALNAQAFHAESKTFVWGGFDWTPEVIGGQLLWIAVAVAITLVAALPFDRFDNAQRRGEQPGWFARIGDSIGGLFRRAALLPTEAPGDVTLTPLMDASRHAQFQTVLFGELRLMLKGLPWWWYAGAAGLVLAALVSPVEEVRRFLLPLVWLLPMPIWSQMGTREARHNTREIVFSAPSPVLGQLPAIWTAGVLIAVILGSGAAIRFAAAGDIPGLAAWASGAVFLPALALTLGVWGGSSRIFEIVLLTMWYVGPMNRVAVLDYTSATPESWQLGMPSLFGAFAAALLIIAVIGRAKELRY